MLVPDRLKCDFMLNLTRQLNRFADICILIHKQADQTSDRMVSVFSETVAIPTARALGFRISPGVNNSTGARVENGFFYVYSFSQAHTLC